MEGGSTLADKTKDNIDFRKKRVKRIKKIIIVLCILLFILPVVLSIVLFFRVKNLENRIETIISENKLESGGKEASTEIVNAKEKEIVTGSAVGEEKTKRVYLTFDDGPSKQTERVLNILKKKKVKATFFAIGREDEFSQNIYRRILKEGHTLGMHSYSHIFNEIYGSLEGFKKDFQRISGHLEKITGVRPVIYRFPGGSSNTVNELPVKQYTNFLKEQGVEYFDWNVIAANGITENVTKKDMVRSVMEGVAKYDTSIVLLYDSADKKMTADSLSAMIDSLQAAGYELLPIDGSTVPIHHS